MSCHPMTLSDMQSLLMLVRQAEGERAQEASLQLRRIDIDLSALTSAPAVQNAKGWGLVFPAFGAPAGASLAVKVDGVELILQPGARLRSPFQRLEVRNAPSGATLGVVTLYVLLEPSTELELGQLGGGSLQGSSAAQLEASAAGNVPTLASQGVSLGGGRGVRAVVVAASGQTITSGTGVWWLYDDLSGVWAESAIQIDLSRTTARRAVALPDEFVTVGRGRAYLECRSVVTSGAGGTTVNLYAN